MSTLTLDSSILTCDCAYPMLELIAAGGGYELLRGSHVSQVGEHTCSAFGCLQKKFTIEFLPDFIGSSDSPCFLVGKCQTSFKFAGKDS